MNASTPRMNTSFSGTRADGHDEEDSRATVALCARCKRAWVTAGFGQRHVCAAGRNFTHQYDSFLSARRRAQSRWIRQKLYNAPRDSTRNGMGLEGQLSRG